jgi:hypothetical protein
MLTYDYMHDFAATADVVIPGTTHQCQTTALDIAVKVPDQHRRLIPYFLPWWFHVDPQTFDVFVHLTTNRHAGVVLLRKAQDAA